MKVGQKLRVEGITYTIKNINPPNASENGKSSQEIELSVLTGYLVCQKCKGHYKLKPGESPEDFTNTCACGGKFRYAIDIEVVGEKKNLGGEDGKTQQRQENNSTWSGGDENKITIKN